MTQTRDYYLASYGLASNPYSRAALNPMANESDAKFYARVSGWTDLPTVRRKVADCVKSGETAYALVSGPSGAGRTSMANYIAYSWADAYPDDAIVREFPRTTYAPKVDIVDWICRLEAFVQDLGLTLSGATLAFFEPFMTGDPGNVTARACKFLRSLMVDLQSAKKSLIFIFEGIEDREYLEKLIQCFIGVKACVIFTIDDTDRNQQNIITALDAIFSDIKYLHTPVASLDGNDARTTVEHRWAQCCPHEFPLESVELADSFGNRRRTFKRIFNLIEPALRFKSRERRSPATWPEEKALGFASGQLAEFIDGQDAQFDGLSA